MKRRMVFFGLVLSLIQIGPTNAYAQSFVEPLKDLKQISIVVESIDSEESNLGLREKEIEGWVLVALRRDIPNLKIDKRATSFVYVNFNFMKDKSTDGRTMGFSGFVSLRIVRPAIIVTDNYDKSIGYNLATVWDNGNLLGGRISSGVVPVIVGSK